MKISGGKAQVFSNRFYLSYQPASSIELRRHVDLFQSRDGLLWACRFPARYLWLKDQTRLPSWDLNQCADLRAFMDSFSFSKIQLALASENIQSPASAFGHLMLVLRSDSLPIDAWPVIHYAALNDPNDSFFAYAIKGITGGYRGAYARTPFFNKYFEYVVTEQRYIYFYDLGLSKDEEKRLLYHLWELRDASFRYFFKDENCAHQIAVLLQTIQQVPGSYEKSWIVFPLDVVRAFGKEAKARETLLPLSRQIEKEYALLNPAEKELFKKVIQGDFTETATASPAFPVASKYATLQFRAKGSPLEAHRKILRQAYTEDSKSLWSQEVDPLSHVRPSLLTMGLRDRAGKKALTTQFRLLYNSMEDPKRSDTRESELKLFDTKLNLDLDSQKLYLRELDIVSFRYLPFRRAPFSPLSWEFSSSLNRKWSESRLSWDNVFHLGLSYNPMGGALASILIGGGHIINGGATPLYFSTKALFSLYVTPSFKLSALLQEKYAGKWFCETGAVATILYSRFFLQGGGLQECAGQRPSLEILAGTHF